MDEVIQIFDPPEVQFTVKETYQLALESVFRWTLMRDELSDTQIVKAIKQVAMVALKDV